MSDKVGAVARIFTASPHIGSAAASLRSSPASCSFSEMAVENLGTTSWDRKGACWPLPSSHTQHNFLTSALGVKCVLWKLDAVLSIPPGQPASTAMAEDKQQYKRVLLLPIDDSEVVSVAPHLSIDSDAVIMQNRLPSFKPLCDEEQPFAHSAAICRCRTQRTQSYGHWKTCSDLVSCPSI